MSDKDPNDNLPGAADDLNAIQILHPEAMGAVHDELVQHIHDAEATYPEKGMGTVKRDYVLSLVVPLLEEVADSLVDAASKIPGFPVPLAGILKNNVIPNLPGWISLIVAGLNAAGVFKK